MHRKHLHEAGQEKKSKMCMLSRPVQIFLFKKMPLSPRTSQQYWSCGPIRPGTTPADFSPLSHLNIKTDKSGHCNSHVIEAETETPRD